MEKFEFKGDWISEIQLLEFAQFDDKSLNRNDHSYLNGMYGLTIHDEKNFNPDPEEYQLNTLNYLLDPTNQKKIISSIYEFIINTVYPDYKEFLSPEEYPESFPDIDNEQDLKNLLAINEVIIYPFRKDDLAYYVLGFNSYLDYEHGLYVTMHKTRPLQHAAMGDLDIKVIFDDNGENYEEFSKSNNNNKELKQYEPHPKYNKLKPWQESANNYYPYGLLHSKRTEELIEFFNDNGNKSKYYGQVLNVSIMRDYKQETERLLEIEPIHTYSSIKTSINIQSLGLLIAIDSKSNEKHYDKVGFDSLLYQAGRQLYKFQGTEFENRAREITRFLIQKDYNPNLKDKFNRDVYKCLGNEDDKMKKVNEFIEYEFKRKTL